MSAMPMTGGQRPLLGVAETAALAPVKGYCRTVVCNLDVN
jgi:hypothetical protein